MLLEFCLEKELCVSNKWFKIEEKRKVAFRMGEIRRGEVKEMHGGGTKM